MTKRNARNAVRAVLLAAAATATIVLIQGWREQKNAPVSCKAAFGELAEHNGYIQIDLTNQHSSEQYFTAEVTLYYATSESPPQQLSVTRDAAGTYAASRMAANLVPFGEGRITSEPSKLDLPTPGLSQRDFPFDSPGFDFALHLSPPQRPKVLIFRNRTSDFIPLCDTLHASWDQPDKLTVQLKFRRNPFVQTVAVILSFAVLAFAFLLGRVKDRDELATATASYFFSLWSIRAIIAPTTVAYPTLLDFWFMILSILVLFIVSWRLTSPASRSRRDV